MSEVKSAPVARCARTHPILTLGMELERDRLERRLQRVTAVLAELHRRASDQRGQFGRPTRPMRQAIGDFEAVSTAIADRLDALAADESPSLSRKTAAQHIPYSDPTVAHMRVTD